MTLNFVSFAARFKRFNAVSRSKVMGFQFMWTLERFITISVKQHVYETEKKSCVHHGHKPLRYRPGYVEWETERVGFRYTYTIGINGCRIHAQLVVFTDFIKTLRINIHLNSTTFVNNDCRSLNGRV